MSAHVGQQPPGTFLPGTKVTVGSHKVTIEKYLSEGGFAHVYVVRVPRPNNKYELAVLKRVAVPDKEHLSEMRTEVETMKKLKGHRHIVTYFDSHASQLQGGGYEVFLLMEFCSGGGLIDFMNTRLQHRLTEPEILKIFADVAEGVAAMHYLQPPLLHRDLKVENVLISKSGAGGAPLYKVCDFGSAARPRPAAKTTEEGRLIEEDVQKHTTMQYRSPEMIDVWRKQPIDEKSDIWALGVFLYKLCYYTTPFEDVGQMAILNATYKYPAYPVFSHRIKKLIAGMLKEDPRHRPTIYQVVKEVCAMRGTEIPIKDIYAARTESEARRNEVLPPKDAAATAAIGLQKASPQVNVQAIPDIAPMRRGRPTGPPVQPATAASAAAKATKGDPFAALDSKNYDVRAGAVDELSKKFPSLDEFSITHDGGAKKFQFSKAASPHLSSSNPESGTAKANLNDRVANALADEVFSHAAPKSAASSLPKEKPVVTAGQTVRSPPVQTTATKSLKTAPMVPVKDLRPAATLPANTVIRTGSQYKSTGTGTSPPQVKPKLPEISNRPIWRVPENSSGPRLAQPASTTSQVQTSRPALSEMHRSKSTTDTLAKLTQPASRPSFEAQRPSNLLDLGDADSSSGPSRGHSADARGRVTSMFVSSDMDYLRDQEQSRRRPSMDLRRHSRQASYSREPSAGHSTTEDAPAIEDNMDYLRTNEDGELARKRSFGKKTAPVPGHQKRASLSALSSNAKQMFSGRFNDAFKRFEGNKDADLALKTPTPHDYEDEEEPRLLSPIAGSEATMQSSRHSDQDVGDLESRISLEETQELPPDMRREMERRQLSQEERRVAEAAAEYRSRVAANGTGSAVPATRANTIQQRVQSLLDEGRQSPAPKKTASGYGHYTDAYHEPASTTAGEDAAAAAAPQNSKPSTPTWTGPPIGARKLSAVPASGLAGSRNPYPKTRTQLPLQSPTTISGASSTASTSFSPVQKVSSAPPQLTPAVSSGVATSLQSKPLPTPRPNAPPKPQSLRKATQGPGSSSPEATISTTAVAHPQPLHPGKTVVGSKPRGGLAALLAKDLEGVPDYPPRGSSMAAAPSVVEDELASEQVQAASSFDNDDLEDFSKRYPSLSGIEMVETEIGAGGRR